MAASSLCDMCQEADFDMSWIIKKDGQTTWLCWACLPQAEAAHLQSMGWAVTPPPAEEAAAVAAVEEEAGPTETSVPRPRVVADAEVATAGEEGSPAAGEAGPEPGDQRGADRVESRGRAGAKSRPPAPGA